MKKVIGIVRNECGTIFNLVMFDTDSRKKYSVSAPANAEVLFGSYPLYNEEMEVIGNKGLIILEKTYLYALTYHEEETMMTDYDALSQLVLWERIFI